MKKSTALLLAKLLSAVLAGSALATIAGAGGCLEFVRALVSTPAPLEDFKGVLRSGRPPSPSDRYFQHFESDNRLTGVDREAGPRNPDAAA